MDTRYGHGTRYTIHVDFDLEKEGESSTTHMHIKHIEYIRLAIWEMGEQKYAYTWRHR